MQAQAKEVKMRRNTVLAGLAGALLIGTVAFRAAAEDPGRYKVTATAIEACSCPLFCPCYFNPEPAGGHMCQFNNAYRFEPGSRWGNVDLSNAKVWVSGDLGGHFGDGTTEWAVVTFDRKTTPEQREAIGGWLGKVFPVQWGMLETREDDLAWEVGPKTAHAKMASGVAEVQLTKVVDPAGRPAMVQNTPYWGSDSNTGFILAHSKHHFKGDQSYSFDRHNGFVITFTSEGELLEK
jgi:hypothetical protein